MRRVTARHLPPSSSSSNNNNNNRPVSRHATHSSITPRVISTVEERRFLLSEHAPGAAAATTTTTTTATTACCGVAKHRRDSCYSTDGASSSTSLLQCSVCLAAFDIMNDHMCETKCGHIFHVHCINMWFQRSQRCPNCNHDQREVAAAADPRQITNNRRSISDVRQRTQTPSVTVTLRDRMQLAARQATNLVVVSPAAAASATHHDHSSRQQQPLLDVDIRRSLAHPPARPSERREQQHSSPPAPVFRAFDDGSTSNNNIPRNPSATDDDDDDDDSVAQQQEEPTSPSAAGTLASRRARHTGAMSLPELLRACGVGSPTSRVSAPHALSDMDDDDDNNGNYNPRRRQVSDDDDDSEDGNFLTPIEAARKRLEAKNSDRGRHHHRLRVLTRQSGGSASPTSGGSCKTLAQAIQDGLVKRLPTAAPGTAINKDFPEMRERYGGTVMTAPVFRCNIQSSFAEYTSRQRPNDVSK